ncbi:MAG: methyltransferase domain-containing protein [Candidatus Thiodiazotropha sp. (ex Dulcina madagascariensis)]|nr:methyltransferase domain-containing protein [Candidatus Thiodiazotropha sp. (ex Dulcina madagascariensis)]
MVTRDPHRFVNELDEAAVERLIARLESRAKDAVFTRLFDKYAARLALPPSARVLEVGCGTGAMMRFLAKRSDFSGKAIGVDQSPPFIKAATGFAQRERVDDRVAFRIGDAHNLDFPAAAFDAVIANTLISHVTEPETVLREMARVVRPGGTVAIFDGDYASLTYAFPDHDFGHQMDVALASASFNNPRIMRDLPRLLPAFGLEVSAAWGDAVVEIGNGSYFKSFAETYAPYVTGAGLLPAEAVEGWLAAQRQAMENGTFFASCTYYTYLAQRS